MKDETAHPKMVATLREGNKILITRRLEGVEDLNLGDIAAFMEASLSFWVGDQNISDYPGFQKLFGIIQKVDGFLEIHERFVEFASQLVQIREDAVKEKCCQTPV